MKHFILLTLSLVLVLTGCSALELASDKASEKVSDIVTRYCSETNEEFREQFRQKINQQLNGHSIRVECQARGASGTNSTNDSNGR